MHIYLYRTCTRIHASVVGLCMLHIMQECGLVFKSTLKMKALSDLMQGDHRRRERRRKEEMKKM